MVSYNVTGQYDVKLTIEKDGESISKTFSLYVNVIDLPTSDFAFTTDELNVQFTNLSLFGDSYLWEFGDGETSDENSPDHTYPSAGRYTVKLTTTNICGEVSNSLDAVLSVVSIADVSDLGNIGLRPNPSMGATQIVWEQALAGQAFVSIYRTDGALIQAQELNIIPDGSDRWIHTIENVKEGSGVYLVKVQQAERAWVTKWVRL